MEKRDLEERVDALERELSKYKGFVGGVIFIVSAIWAFLEMFGKELARVFGLK